MIFLNQQIKKELVFDIKNLKAVFHYANNVSEVTLNRHEWSKSTCTCCYFLKNYRPHIYLFLLKKLNLMIFK